MNNKTKINWTLHNYCKAECSYCPAKHWGGDEPRHFNEYVFAANKLIDHFTKMNRTIDWSFTGGEPLEFFELPMLLKLCKTDINHITLHTNGGTSILNWFAIEPYVDEIILTVHYWQNPHLIKYIIETFREKNKKILIYVPLRPENFDEDLAKIEKLQETFDVEVNFQILFKNNEILDGVDSRYKFNKLIKIFTVDKIMNYKKWIILSFDEKRKLTYNNSPVYTGKKCMAGIEQLYITEDGWVLSSMCNNINMGNIFNNTLRLIFNPEPCRNIACTDKEDQKITKFT